MTAVLVVLAAIVVVVAIDAIGRLDERGKKPEAKPRDPSVTTSQKIIVDLSKRE
jgi:hypothetical protein